MAHTVRSQGATNPHQSIRRRARIRSGGPGRYTPTAVRLAPPDRTGGRPSGPWRPSNGSPHGPSHPCCVPWPEGLDTGGAGLGPQGCTRCPTGAASFRSDLRRPPSSDHSSPTLNSPHPYSMLRYRARLDQPYRAWTCELLSCSPVRRRQSAGLVTVHLSGTCYPGVLFSCLHTKFFFSTFCPGVNHSRPHIPLPLTCL